MSTSDETTEPSVFDRTADVSYSRRDRVIHLLDKWILAPFRVMWQDWRAKIGLLITTVYLLMGTVGVIVVPKPTLYGSPVAMPPFRSLQYPLGTTKMGRGLLRSIVHSTPAMLEMSIVGATFTVVLATVVGTVAGISRGSLDSILMTIADIVLVIPGLPLIIVLSIAFAPEDPWAVGLLLSINAWAGLARNLRSQVLSLREHSYVEASKTMGLSTPTIIRSDLLPNMMPYILTNYMLSIRNIIFSSVALYFLGLLPFTTLNWGVMMNLARQAGALISPHLFYLLAVPMATIVLYVYGFVLLAQGMDRVFNPRVRARHEETASDSDHQPGS